MTDNEKKRVQYLRQEGFGYGAIAEKIGISENTVKSFCRRNGLTGVASKTLIHTCRQCGKTLVQEEGKPTRTRKFCSEACRRAWWKVHPELINKKAFYAATCAYCGKEFQSYGNRNRKYCSHHCYIMARFGDEPRKWEVLERGKKD